ncbi:MAG: glycosyltransferase [Thiobacillus sp.]
MDFSVVIPSRNRPALLREAVASVLAQTHSNREILIVNDGSAPEHLADYQAIAAQTPDVIRLITLETTQNGHGPSYAINRGAEAATGRYLCFLDDDDSWTDPQHLARAWVALTQVSPAADYYLSNQKAFTPEGIVTEPLWLESLAAVIPRHAAADPAGVSDVALELLMTASAFPHLNNMIVERALYASIGGMDENIRYECEWDLYFRILDRARRVRYYPGIVSRHNVPDRSRTVNASTAVSPPQKLLFRAIVMDKALLNASAPAIRTAARQVKLVTYKNLARSLHTSGKLDTAWLYARQALGLSATPKWLVYCLYLGLLKIASTFTSAK